MHTLAIIEDPIINDSYVSTISKAQIHMHVWVIQIATGALVTNMVNIWTNKELERQEACSLMPAMTNLINCSQLSMIMLSRFIYFLFCVLFLLVLSYCMHLFTFSYNELKWKMMKYCSIWSQWNEINLYLSITTTVHSRFSLSYNHWTYYSHILSKLCSHYV